MAVPDYSDRTPARRQIADDLRSQIRAGKYAPGDRLPSNVELAKHYGVATETIRAALAQLSTEGVVATQSTRGTYVTSLPTVNVQPDLKAVAEELAELAERTQGYDDLRARVGRMEAILINLHVKLGLENPYGGAHDAAQKAPRRGRAGR